MRRTPQAKHDMGTLLRLNTEVLERALIIFGGIVQCRVVWPWVLFRETMVYIWNRRFNSLGSPHLP